MAENKERALKPKAFTPTFKIENNIIDDFLAEDESLFELFDEEIEDERLTKIKNYYKDLMKNQSPKHSTNKLYQYYIDALSEETWEDDPASMLIKEHGGGYDDYLTLKSESIDIMTEKHGKALLEELDIGGYITPTQFVKWKNQRK